MRGKMKAFILFLILLPGLAQAGGWRTYTNTNYLSDLKVIGSQVWWGTTGGVVRYDNSDSSYTIYRNTEGLGGINVQAVEVDEEGNLWFGLVDGVLNRLGPHGQWSRASLGFAVNDLVYHQGYLWVATEQNLIKFDPQTWLSLEVCEQPGVGLQRDRPIRCLFFWGDTLWAGTEGGISYIDITQTENLRDPAQWTYFTTENNPSLGEDKINTITSYQGEICAGTKNGIYKFADSSWHAVGGDWHKGVVYDLRTYSDTLLAITAKGVWRWDGANLDSLKCPSSVPRKLSVGPQGELWVGTWGEGTLLYLDGGWQYPFETEGSIGNRIADMALDDEGNLWLASPGYGMSGFDGKRWENFTPIADTTLHESNGYHESPISRGLCAVAADRLGNKWFGLWAGGVIKLDPEGNQTLYDEDNSILRWSDPNYKWATWNVVVNQIIVDNANNKYFANWYRGVVVLDSEEVNWIVYPQKNEGGLFSALIQDMLIDNQGGKWFAHLPGVGGSQGGISHLIDDNGTPFNRNDDKWEHFLGERDGLLNNKVNSLAIDLDGSIWMGTDEGVSRYDSLLSPVPIPGYRFLPNYLDMIGQREVNSIEVDTKGNKWFGTSNGLLRYDGENFLWQEFTPKTSSLLDEKINCLLLDKAQGYLWIGTDKGLSMYELGIVEPESTFSQLLVYPNPLLLSQDGTEVKFKRLTATSIVYIFTVNGELVREIPSDGSGLVSWDGRNQGGNLVASGVYLWVVRDKNGNSRRGKIAVIR